MPQSVLVVDDDRDIAAVITDVLIEEGYDATSAFDGQQALDRLAGNHIDLLVSDIRMPRLDGISLINLLRDRGWTNPVVLMSAVDTEYKGQDGVVFMRKPVDLDTLIDLVHDMLEQPNGKA